MRLKTDYKISGTSLTHLVNILGIKFFIPYRNLIKWIGFTSLLLTPYPKQLVSVIVGAGIIS